MEIMFGLRKKPPKPNLAKIYVSDSGLSEDAEYHSAAMEIIDYTNAAMHSSSLFKVGEFPIEAFQIYCADYYVGQVNNGGHSQYVSNDRNSGATDSTIPYALDGLKLIGTHDFANILEQLIAWMKANPDETLEQNGFTNRADQLEKLDELFYALDDKDYYQAVRSWLKSSKLVEILPQTQFRDELENLKSRNHSYDSRMRTQIISALDAGITKDTIAQFRACVAGCTTHDKLIEIQTVLSGSANPMIDRSSPGFDFTKPENLLWTLETNMSGYLYGQTRNGNTEILLKNPETNEYEILFSQEISITSALLNRASQKQPGRYALHLLKEVTPEDEPLFLNFGSPEIGDPAENTADHYAVSCKSGNQYLLSIGVSSAALQTLEGEMKVLATINGKAFSSLSEEDHTRLV